MCPSKAGVGDYLVKTGRGENIYYCLILCLKLKEGCHKTEKTGNNVI
jgi:hypothetical protein